MGQFHIIMDTQLLFGPNKSNISFVQPPTRPMTHIQPFLRDTS